MVCQNMSYIFGVVKIEEEELYYHQSVQCILFVEQVR